MKTIYVGMDVHSGNFTLCCYTIENEELAFRQTIVPDYKMVLKYLEKVRQRNEEEVTFVCGYEAGCLGYKLYHQLTDHGVKCVILAPSTMGITNTSHIKTDKRDAANIARCLAFHTYTEVFIPTKEDESVKDYIRMRDDHQKILKAIKQQILALVFRHGYVYDGGKNYWTGKHLS